MEACAVICRKGKRLCGCASRCQLSFFPVPIPVSPSTKSGFLCFFALLNPCFRAFRAQNRVFCALLGSGSSVFRLFEHKIEVFVRFWPSRPSFSGFSSTQSPFLCSFTKLDVGVGALSRRKRHRHTCAAVAPAQPILPLTLPPLHLRSRCTCSPLHLLSRCTCATAVPAAVARRCTCAAAVPDAVACRSSLPPSHLTARAG